MKVLMTALLLTTMALPHAHAQDFKLTSQDMQTAAADLDADKDNPEHSVDTRRLMGKVADQLRVAADANESEPQKKPSFWAKAGRTLGKGATWLSVQTMKPFMTAGSFLTGFFEKEEKNQEVVGLYRVFLNNAPEFDDLYKEAGTPEEFVQLLMLKFEQIIEKKANIIMHDALVAIAPGVEIPANIQEMDWSKIDLSKIDESKIDPKLVNEHPEYQDLRPILGDFTKEDLEKVLETGYYDPSVDFENVKAAMPRIHELAGTLVGQIFGPKIVLGMISGSLAGLYTTPVLLADVGAGVSVAICVNKKTQEQFKDDDDLKQFCSYTTNWSSYQLMKSRAKGYVSGKKAKSDLKKWNKRRLERREQKRRARELASQA